MSRDETKKSLLARTMERALWIALLMSVIGMAGILWGGSGHGAGAAAAANFGSVLVTIGIVGILYDLLLRRSLIGEVLDAVGVHRSMQAFGLQHVGSKADFVLADLLNGARQVTALPLDPLRWSETEFETIRSVAQSRPLDVTVLLPAQDNPYVQLLAERLDKTEGQVLQLLNDVTAGRLGAAWQAAGCRGKLEVFRYSGVPTTGLIETDRAVAIEIGPLIRYGPMEREGYVLVAERAHTPLAKWISDQIARERADENLSQVDERASREATELPPRHYDREQQQEEEVA